MLVYSKRAIYLYYDLDYHTEPEDTSQKKDIFTENDVCLIINIAKDKWYSRWMGTIVDNNGDKKSVVFFTVTGHSF